MREIKTRPDQAGRREGEPRGLEEPRAQHLIGWEVTQNLPPLGDAAALPGGSERAQIRARAQRLAREHGPFEWSEVAHDLSSTGHYYEEAEFWRAVLGLYDCSPRVQLYLADALIGAGLADEALEIAASAHRLEPELYECQEQVLDILFATGRTEDDFEWEQAPDVVRLGSATRDRIHQLLQIEGTQDLFDLRFSLFEDQYVTFNIGDLAADLERDPRFEVGYLDRTAIVELAEERSGTHP